MLAVVGLFAEEVLWSKDDHSDFHKAFVFDARNIVALALAFVVSALALAAGVGGGAFFVPLFNVVVGFSLKAAGSTSQAAIFGGSIASTFVNARQPCPGHPSKCLIDFELALIVTPMLLVGVDLGVLVNTLLPDWLMALGLVLLLSYMSWRTSSKGRAMWHKETRLKKRQSQLSLQSSQAGASTPDLNALPAGTACKVHYPFIIIAEILLLWLIFMSLAVLQHQFDRCSWQFGAMLGAEVMLCICSGLLFIRQVLTLRAAKVPAPLEEGLLSQEGSGQGQETVAQEEEYEELDYSVRVLVHSATGACVAGAVAGLLGLGGGMLFTPLLLEYGISPQVATATANLLILFSSSSATLAWGMGDMLNYQYAAVYFSVCVVGAFTGLYVIGGYVKRSGRNSALVLLLAGIMAGGALLTGIFVGIEVWHKYQEGTIEVFHPWCQ